MPQVTTSAERVHDRLLVMSICAAFYNMAVLADGYEPEVIIGKAWLDPNQQIPALAVGERGEITQKLAVFFAFALRKLALEFQGPMLSDLRRNERQ
jgi:hypothetical protein